MKNFRTFLWVLVGGLLMLGTFSCEKSSLDEPGELPDEQLFGEDGNYFEGPIPEATVELKDYSSFGENWNKSRSSERNGNKSSVGSGSTLIASIEATLYPEESHTQTLTGTIDGGPSAGDLMFVMDLTGSMGDELNNAKVNSVNIMNAIRTIIPNTNFGLISHMDYNSVYSGCGYYSQYGSYGDYPYMLNNVLTENILDVQTGLNSLSLGGGWDIPESYTRAIWELANDSNIGWRSGSKKIAIAWLDAIPHDCDVYGLIETTLTTGIDPGRDNIGNNEDDLVFYNSLEQLRDENISLITLYSGFSSDFFDVWSAASEMTGGKAYRINPDGTIPGGTDLGAYLATLIAEDLNTIEELTIEVCDPAYEEWLTGLSPQAYYNLLVDSPISKDYDVTITPPAGTAPDIYEFELCLVGDGAVYATTTVKITVPENNVEASFDVHPMSCPNPIGRHNRGLTPVSINGTADFDVEEIDVSSITLEGVNPVSHSFEDVSTPYLLESTEVLDLNDCHTAGADGYLDLSLKFDTQQLLSSIGPVEKGDVLLVTIEGQLLDGTDFHGSDVIVIQ